MEVRAFRVFPRNGINRRKSDAGGPPGAPHLVQARPGGRAWAWCGPPGACLRLFFGLLDGSGENRDFCLRGVQFREYFQNNFSETKNSRKQGTGTGHLVNRLVPENVGKRVKTYGKHVVIGIISTWNIRNYRYVGDVSSIPKLSSYSSSSR